MNTKAPTVRSKSAYPIKKVVNQQIELPPDYKLIEKVGQGSFGEIFKIYNHQNLTLHACKVEFKDNRSSNQQPLLIKEYEVYQALQGIPQIPQPYQLIQKSNCNIMIMPYYGLGNLEELRKKRGKFTEHCTMRLAYSLINVIEQVHERRYIHRDIKPENFLVGSLGDQHSIYLIDYGLAKHYMDGNQHINQADNKGMVGTARYTSINSHLGIEQSRRDDLEAICYVLLYLYNGSVPWQNFTCASRLEKFQKILDQKQKFSASQLEFDVPPSLREIYNYSRQLKFDQKPDYGKLKEICKTGFNAQKYYCFDWCPDDCKLKPYEEQQDLISELGYEYQTKKMNKTLTTHDYISLQGKKQAVEQQISEENEESISEFPQAQQIQQFFSNYRH